MKLDLNTLKAKKSIKELINFGIINIDKPSGPTSFSVSDYVRKSLEINKTSHTGTLDPMVSGVLPILLGRACRLSDYFMHRDKTYTGIMRLHSDVSDEKLKEIISKFIGKIQQLPPVRSRVKREVREREVISFDILEREGKDVLFETKVQAGTYIRKICDDMGKEIGGAHMLELRRTEAGIFAEPAHSLYDLDSALELLNKGDESLFREMLIPGEIILNIFPSVNIRPEYLKKCYTGSPLFHEFLESEIKLPTGDKICARLNNTFIGCYKVVNEGQILAIPEFVFNSLKPEQ
ncbi:RNA-guided pseudouridylation complex pseudouridine synthase subunit Cbf5 [Candidatus Pacearchaeota archaeon]|nr:RNA-guided pseudouridylation complex pseudouridine synthase subunit Cbf5 [Candidatus Pacearchaeota archaeon]